MKTVAESYKSDSASYSSQIAAAAKNALPYKRSWIYDRKIRLKTFFLGTLPWIPLVAGYRIFDDERYALAAVGYFGIGLVSSAIGGTVKRISTIFKSKVSKEKLKKYSLDKKFPELKEIGEIKLKEIVPDITQEILGAVSPPYGCLLAAEGIMSFSKRRTDEKRAERAIRIAEWADEKIDSGLPEESIEKYLRDLKEHPQMALNI